MGHRMRPRAVEYVKHAFDVANLDMIRISGL
jgi:hypothetical protein